MSQRVTHHVLGNFRFRTTIEANLSGFVRITTQNAAGEVESLSLPVEALLDHVAQMKLDSDNAVLVSKRNGDGARAILGIHRDV